VMGQRGASVRSGSGTALLLSILWPLFLFLQPLEQVAPTVLLVLDKILLGLMAMYLIILALLSGRVHLGKLDLMTLTLLALVWGVTLSRLPCSGADGIARYALLWLLYGLGLASRRYLHSGAVASAFVGGCFVVCVLLIATPLGVMSGDNRLVLGQVSPNHMGVMLATAVVITVFGTKGWTPAYAVYRMVVAGALTLAIFLGGSRTAIICLATGAVVMWGRQRGLRLAFLGPVGALAGCLLLWVYYGLGNRVFVSGVLSDARLKCWSTALGLVRSSTTVSDLMFGHGIGSSPSLLGQLLGGNPIGAHNAFLTVLIEAGVVGLAGILVFLTLVVLNTRGAVPQAVVAILLVACMTLDMFTQKYFWALLALSGLLARSGGELRHARRVGWQSRTVPHSE